MDCCDRKGKKEGWRLEPERETETPEVIVLWSEVEGVLRTLMVKATMSGLNQEKE